MFSCPRVTGFWGDCGVCLKRNLVSMAARGGESLDHSGSIVRLKVVACGLSPK